MSLKPTIKSPTAQAVTNGLQTYARLTAEGSEVRRLDDDAVRGIVQALGPDDLPATNGAPDRLALKLWLAHQANRMGIELHLEEHGRLGAAAADNLERALEALEKESEELWRDIEGALWDARVSRADGREGIDVDRFVARLADLPLQPTRAQLTRSLTTQVDRLLQDGAVADARALAERFELTSDELDSPHLRRIYENKLSLGEFDTAARLETLVKPGLGRGALLEAKAKGHCNRLDAWAVNARCREPADAGERVEGFRRDLRAAFAHAERLASDGDPDLPEGALDHATIHGRLEGLAEAFAGSLDFALLDVAMAELPPDRAATLRETVAAKTEAAMERLLRGMQKPGYEGDPRLPEILPRVTASYGGAEQEALRGAMEAGLEHLTGRDSKEAELLRYTSVRPPYIKAARVKLESAKTLAAELQPISEEVRQGIDRLEMVYLVLRLKNEAWNGLPLDDTLSELFGMVEDGRLSESDLKDRVRQDMLDLKFEGEDRPEARKSLAKLQRTFPGLKLPDQKPVYWYSFNLTDTLRDQKEHLLPSPGLGELIEATVDRCRVHTDDLDPLTHALKEIEEALAEKPQDFGEAIAALYDNGLFPVYRDEIVRLANVATDGLYSR